MTTTATPDSTPADRSDGRRPRTVLGLVLLSFMLLAATFGPAIDSASAQEAEPEESTATAVEPAALCSRSVEWPTFRNFGLSDRGFITTGTNRGSSFSTVLRQIFHVQDRPNEAWRPVQGRARFIDGKDSIETRYQPRNGQNWHHTSQIKACNGVTPILRAVTMVDFDLGGYNGKRQNFREYYCWETNSSGTASRVRCPGGSGDEDLRSASRTYRYDLRGNQR